MTPDEIRQEMFSALRAIAEDLPDCPKCGALAIGMHEGKVSVIGRKRYAEPPLHFCENHPPVEGTNKHLFAYHRAAERYNRATAAALKEFRSGT